MDQGYLRFNPEALEDTYLNKILRESCEDYDEFVCNRRTNDYQYIARQMKTNNIDNQQFAKFRKIKLYNILPVLDLYREEKTLVSQDFEQYSLFNNSQCLDLNSKLFIAAFTSMTLQELCLRGFPYKISPKKLFIIENHVCIQQIDFDFNHQTTEEECFASFLKLLNYLKLQINCNSFEEATNTLLELQEVETGQTENMPYVDFLMKVFSFQNSQSLVSDIANSYVYVFDTPEFLKTTPGLSNQIVLKSMKIDNSDADQEYLIRCADRELRIMENFKKYEPLAACFGYFRIQKQLYLFMELYAGDLQQAFILSEIFDRNVKDLCCQLAVAVKHLHKHRIIHRDLKPTNIFLSNYDLDRAKVLIADFDHSIEIENAQEGLQTLSENTGLTGSTGYEPPETGRTNYDFKADIWQIGMIFYQIANQGVHPIQRDTLYLSNEQFQQIADFDNIKQKLEEYNVSDEFVKLIADCLSFDPQNRPDSIQLIQRLMECFDDTLIDIDDDENQLSTHQMCMIESYGLLAERSTPLRQIQSSNF